MKIKYEITTIIEAESIEEGAEKLHNMLQCSINNANPLDASGHRLSSRYVKRNGELVKVFYEPLCPYSYTDCICDPAIQFLQDSDKTIFTKDDYPEEIDYDGCGSEERDIDGDCVDYDDECK